MFKLIFRFVYFFLKRSFEEGGSLTCSEGFVISNSTESFSKVSCLEGDWVVASNNAPAVNTMCIPYCEMPCENNGTCSKPNTCVCIYDFYGDTCSYSKCPTTLPVVNNGAFTGRYVCSRFQLKFIVNFLSELSYLFSKYSLWPKVMTAIDYLHVMVVTSPYKMTKVESRVIP